MGLTGNEFETLVKPFFEQLFEDLGFDVLHVRGQLAGTQNGFDLRIEFKDRKGKTRNLFIECKYYSTKLPWSEIFRKQVELNAANYSVDGFLLLSPKRDLSNIDDNIQAKAEKKWFGFPTAFWTPDSGVNQLFSIDDELHRKIYGVEYDGEVDVAKVLKRTKLKIEDLLEKKDNPDAELPAKRSYPEVSDYISRNVVPMELSSMGHLWSEGADIMDELQKHKRIALLGWAGTGKSIELEVVAYKYSNSPDPFYPFLIRLNNHALPSIVDSIPELKNIPSSSVVLLLDGLDEVQTGKFDDTRRKILDFATAFPEARIVVSCRSNFYTTVQENGELNTLSGFKSFQLTHLSAADVDEYLKLKIPLKRESFLEEAYRRKLGGLLNVPYYLIKLTEQYSNPPYKLSNSKAELFESVIVENIRKDVFRHFPDDREVKEREMRTALEKVAFSFEYQGKNTGKWSEIEKILSRTEQKIVKCAGSVIDGQEGTDSDWKFGHNNFQEYLAASVLKDKSVRTVREVLCFPKNYNKVKPSWLNTLAFLVNMLPENSDASEGLLGWLVSNEPETLIKFEPDKLNERVKHQVYKQLFLFYKKHDRPINRAKYNLLELGNFSISSQSLDLLLEHLGLAESISTQGNALELIAYFPIESKFPEYIDKAKTAIKEILFGDSGNQYLAMRAYVELFSLSDSEVDALADKFMDSNSAWLRFTLFFALHHFDRQDYHLDKILEYTERYISRENDDEDRLTNEYDELVNCINNVISEDAIVTVARFVMSNYGAISYSVYFEGLIENCFRLVLEKYPNNEEIYLAIKAGYLAECIGFNHQKEHHFTDYFDRTNSRVRAFKEIYSDHAPDVKWTTLIQLSTLANLECIEFIATEFTDGKLEKSVVQQFQNCLNPANGLLEPFNTLVNTKEMIPLPEYPDLEKERLERRERTRSLLFDKEAFIAAIEQVFSDAGKDVLQYEDTRQIGSTMVQGKYLPVVYDMFRIQSHQRLTKSIMLARIEERWRNISIDKICDYLRSSDPVEFTVEQREYVQDWCRDKLTEIDFRTAIKKPDERTTRVNPIAIKLSFLIRRLNFIDFDEEVYLRLLMFYRWDDNQIDIFDFVETAISKVKIDKAVGENLANGLTVEMVLQNHLDYCVKHNLTQFSELIVNYIIKGGYSARIAFNKFKELGGSTELLESIMYDTPDDVKYDVVQELINRDSDKVLKFLTQEFWKSKSKDEKLRVSEFLVVLQNPVGLLYYVKRLKSGDPLPTISYFSSPLNKLRVIWALPLILHLFWNERELSTYDKGSTSLRDVAISSIQAISLAADNYPICFQIYRFYRGIQLVLSRVSRNKESLHKLKSLDHAFENMEQQYYVQKGSRIGLSETLALLSKFGL